MSVENPIDSDGSADALERQEFVRGLNEDYQSLDDTGRATLHAEQEEWDPLV